MYKILLGSFIFLACLSDVVWLRLNVAPPRMWDDASYLAESVVLYRTLDVAGLKAFLVECVKPSRGGHPPMMKILPLPFYLLFHPGTNSALYAYTFLIPVFCVYLFLLTNVLFDSEKIALLSVVITCLFPLTYGLWRNFLSEFGLAVVVLASLYHLVRSEEFRNRKHVLLLGMFLGWGLLWKILFPIFVIGPIAYLLFKRVRRLRSEEEVRSLLRHLMLLLSMVCVVAGPFYIMSGYSVVRFAGFAAKSSDFTQHWSMGPVYSLSTLVHYWLRMINFGISVYFFGLLSFLCFLCMIWRRKIFLRPAWRFLGAWFLLPFLVGSFSVMKDYRHMFPIYPVFGILGAALVIGTLGALKKTGQIIILVLMMIYPLYQFLIFSFDLGFLPRKDMRAGPFILSIKDLEMASMYGAMQMLPLYTFPANPVEWPIDKAVEIIASRFQDRSRALRLHVNANLSYFSPPVLWYQSVLKGLPMWVEDRFGVACGISPADFLVTLSASNGRYGSMVSEDPYLRKLLNERRLPFIEIGKVSLPDQSEAIIYQKVSDPSVYLTRTDLMQRLLEQAETYGTDYYIGSKGNLVINSDARSVVVQNPGTSINIPFIYIPNSGASFQCGVAVYKPDRAADCPRTYQIKATELAEPSQAHVLLSRTIPFANSPDAKWYDERVALDRYRGKIIKITLGVLPNAPEDEACRPIAWSHLNVIYD